MEVLTLDLSVRAERDAIDPLRASVRCAALAVLGDEDASDSVALVATELAENALFHGSWVGTERRIRVVVRVGADKAVVCVTSPIAPGGAAELIESLRELGDHASAERAFQVRLSAIPGSSAVEASRLGLARIAYETGCSLRADVGEKTVDVIADVALRRRP